MLADHRGDRGFDGLVDHVKVARRFVGFEHDEFGDEFAEGAGRRVFVTQHSELVFHQRVVEYMQFHASQITAICVIGRAGPTAWRMTMMQNLR